jgi:hypothetical protein
MAWFAGTAHSPSRLNDLAARINTHRPLLQGPVPDCLGAFGFPMVLKLHFSRVGMPFPHVHCFTWVPFVLPCVELEAMFQLTREAVEVGHVNRNAIAGCEPI